MIALIETALPQVETRVRTMQTRARRISTEGIACWFHIMVTGGGGSVTWSRNCPMSPEELLRTAWPEISRVLFSIVSTRIETRV